VRVRANGAHPGGVATPEDLEDIASIVRGERSRWVAVDEKDARPGDVIEIRIQGLPCHVGIVIAPRLFLHALRDVGGVVERWDDMMWRRRVLGFWRHPELAA
jgi:cell wall-associated NlpC family hydrolase